MESDVENTTTTNRKTKHIQMSQKKNNNFFNSEFKRILISYNNLVHPHILMQ